MKSLVILMLRITFIKIFLIFTFNLDVEIHW